MAACGLRAAAVLGMYLALVLAVRPDGGTSVSPAANESLVEVRVGSEEKGGGEFVDWLCCLENWPPLADAVQGAAKIKEKMLAGLMKKVDVNNKYAKDETECKVWAFPHKHGGKKSASVPRGDWEEECYKTIVDSYAFKRNFRDHLDDFIQGFDAEAAKELKSQITNPFEKGAKWFNEYTQEIGDTEAKKFVATAKTAIATAKKGAEDKFKAAQEEKKKQIHGNALTLIQGDFADEKITGPRPQCSGVNKNQSDLKRDSKAKPTYCCCVALLGNPAEGAYATQIPINERFAQSADDDGICNDNKTPGWRSIEYTKAYQQHGASWYDDCKDFSTNCPICQDQLGACDTSSGCRKTQKGS